MRIDCLHGYYKFTETRPGQLAVLTNRFGFELERSGDHFTFSGLVDAPRYSLIGKPYLGTPALSAFAGDPWDVMEENGYVFDFTKGLILPKLAIIAVAEIQQAGGYWITSGLLMGGCLTSDASRVTHYSGHYDASLALFKYSEIEYE